MEVAGDVDERYELLLLDLTRVAAQAREELRVAHDVLGTLLLEPMAATAALAALGPQPLSAAPALAVPPSPNLVSTNSGSGSGSMSLSASSLHDHYDLPLTPRRSALFSHALAHSAVSGGGAGAGVELLSPQDPRSAGGSGSSSSSAGTSVGSSAFGGGFLPSTPHLHHHHLHHSNSISAPAGIAVSLLGPGPSSRASISLPASASSSHHLHPSQSTAASAASSSASAAAASPSASAHSLASPSAPPLLPSPSSAALSSLAHSAAVHQLAAAKIAPRTFIADHIDEYSEVHESYSRLIGELRPLEERAAALTKFYNGKHNNATKETLYLLTILTTFIAPIQIGTGIYGVSAQPFRFNCSVVCNRSCRTCRVLLVAVWFAGAR